MPQTNIIYNGTFSVQITPPGASWSVADGWTGTDLESNNAASVYLTGGSGSNIVAEMDGEAGAITVMQQTIHIDHAMTTELTLDAALRGGGSVPGNGTAGVDG
jgi:hypothetical protein